MIDNFTQLDPMNVRKIYVQSNFQLNFEFIWLLLGMCKSYLTALLTQNFLQHSMYIIYNSNLILAKFIKTSRPEKRNGKALLYMDR